MFTSIITVCSLLFVLLGESVCCHFTFLYCLVFTVFLISTLRADLRFYDGALCNKSAFYLHLTHFDTVSLITGGTASL